MLLTNLLYAVVIIAIVAAFTIWNNSPKKEAERNRKAVEQIRTQLPENFHLLTDVILESQSGTLLFPAVVVSRYGIFLMEIKHYARWMYGDGHEEHVDALRLKLKDFPDVQITPVAVYTSHSIITNMVTPYPVVQVDHIKSFLEQQLDTCLTDEQVQRVIELIQK